MGVLSDSYNITFSVERMTPGVGRIDTEVVVSTGNNGVFRPVTKRTELFNESNWGKEYQLYCQKTVDIEPNDTITINTVRYGIDNIGFFEDLTDASEDHFEVRIYKKDTKTN